MQRLYRLPTPFTYARTLSRSYAHNMTSAQIDVQAVAVLVAVACALPGVLLVLRGMGMMADAISHAILPGLVLAFFWTEDLGSPLLLVAAAATGLLNVALVEALERTRLVKEDAAIGLVFPALFSLGVVLIGRYAGDVHLDTDAVLLGEIAFAPFDRLMAFGRDLGPRAAWVMGAVGTVNAIFLATFHKELKLATFDAGLAAALGFLPAVLHYALMGLVSLTAVAAFDAVGSILVVALMVGPPLTAYLLTDRLGAMYGLSVVAAAVSALSGYWIARWLDASIAGSMAGAVGLVFLLTWTLAPGRGLLAGWRRRRERRMAFAETMLLVHLAQHEGTAEAARENRPEHLREHVAWSEEGARRTVERARGRDLVRLEDGQLHLTARGRTAADRAARGV